MKNKQQLSDSTVFSVINYIWWFMVSNFYFWLMNIPLIVLFGITNGSANIGFFLFIVSLPVGPALTALLSIMGKLIREKDLNITKDFFTAYKTNFLESLFFWSLLLTIIFILNLDKIYINSIAIVPWLQGTLSIFIIMCVTISFYIFPIISRFYFKKSDVIKISIYYLIKKMHIGVVAFILIYLMSLVPNNIFSIIVLLFSTSFLSYSIMLMQKSTLKEIEEKINCNSIFI